jgi:phytoene synthase
MPGRPDSSPTRALAWLYSPAPTREALALLSALEAEIGASLRAGLDHDVAHARLAWWREECARALAGQPAHPLTIGLNRMYASAGGTPAGIRGFVDTAVWDLAAATFETRRELTAYCERWSAAMIEPLVQLAAPGVPLAQARALGVPLRESELLLGIAGDAGRGRLRVPLDELEHAGIAPERLAQPPWPPQLAELVRARYRTITQALASGLTALAPAQRSALRGLIVWVVLAARQCERAARRLPLPPRAQDEHAPLDAWRAWRAARRAATSHGMLLP